MYHITILATASKELEKLDKAIIERVDNKIVWLSMNLDIISPEALTGNLSGFYKLRVGDYRVIYEIIRDKKLIIIHAIGHRKEIYGKK